jgi:peptidyl-prolyl cis-trans isomerase C
MRNLSIMLIAFSFILTCCGCAPKDKTVLKIGSIELTQKEFEAAFKRSPNGVNPAMESRKQFLQALISRKLILKEAEKMGLDKNPEFLDSVQLFWEQSLLKLMLNEKIMELSAPIKVSDSEVKAYYERHKPEFTGKGEADAVKQIALELFKEKQRKALDEWVNSLRKNTKIEVDYRALGLGKGE